MDEVERDTASERREVGAREESTRRSRRALDGAQDPLGALDVRARENGVLALDDARDARVRRGHEEAHERNEALEESRGVVESHAARDAGASDSV